MIRKIREKWDGDQREDDRSCVTTVDLDNTYEEENK
jgi:hypothetical protein